MITRGCPMQDRLSSEMGRWLSTCSFVPSTDQLRGCGHALRPRKHPDYRDMTMQAC